MPTQAGSAFETVVVVVFERFEGVLDIVRHHALVRAAPIRRRGIDERRLAAFRYQPGSVTSVAPVSNSSQSSFPATASQDATSERLSSTLRSTTCALRITIESLPSVISVLSPVAVTLGAAEVLENAALGAGAAAWRAVSARLTVPILESEQAASANDSASATSVTFFILPPQQSLDGYAYDLAPEGWQAMCRARSGRGTCGASTTRERPHMCSRHVAHSPASNRRKCRPL